MQQVDKDRRFWWRALEAPSPEPAFIEDDAPHDAPENAEAIAPIFSVQDFTPHVAPSAPLSLHVLPGERRRLTTSRGRKSRRRGRMLHMLIIAVAAGTAAVGAFAVDSKAIETVRADIKANIGDGAVLAGFGIGEVSVTGHRYASDTDVYNALDLENVRTFWDLDAREAVRRIERIAWVDRAEITRLYPNALRIDIRERTPQLVWARGEQNYLIDGTGRVLASLETGHTWRLPRITGEGANTELRSLFVALSRHARLFQNLLHAERISERRWRLVSKSGSWLELAAEREADGLAVVSNDPSLVAAFTGAPSIIDVRTPGRITIRPRLANLTRAADATAVGATSVASGASR